MPDRNRSPWAYEDEEMKCPKCGSTRVTRVFKRWALLRRVQAFDCHSCGKKFYLRNVDDYRPTFER